VRAWLVVTALGALGLGLTACGNSSANNTSTASSDVSAVVPPNFTTHNNDRDNDGDHNDDDGKVLYYGHAADAADRQAGVALATSYFAAAASANGAAGCALLVPFIAESVADENPALAARTCPAALSKLFELHHRLLAEKHATLKVMAVRIEDNRGLVILDFPTIPEVRQLTERRIGDTWKLMDLLDGILE
jgi:hypothetical protein